MSKASLKYNDDSGIEQKVSCLYNPAELQIQRSNTYTEHKVPGLDRPILQFINGEAETMTFSLFFDTYSSGIETGQLDLMLNNKMPTLLKADVRKYTEPVYNLITVDESEHAPKEVTFEWGKMSFTGYIVSLNEKLTMFSSLGVPLRSTLEITMKSSVKDNMIRNSPDRTKHRIINSGDALYRFAYAEYGDCSEWRRIAEANGLDNPRRMKSGERIVIPAII
ncbi:hypothetical protein REC12_24495 [Desulfosporosinus sp. PR]|uniref:CIS tube protein n=1 Tax=Candidatus Desulfosporosinus nitrosoreducens TaxID=3401928 RepID=UPI0027EB07B9|nr:hypothetical protein [Desulfosporosinus sp. PR]MDQ7096757.1 hypothetical protein [Desulfosporosinus sp. PR]